MVTNVTKTTNVTKLSKLCHGDELMKEKIIQTAQAEMDALKMKDREFQKHLNASLSPSSDTYIKSKTTILNMRIKGIPPSHEVLEDLLSVYEPSDRRFHFILKILAIKSPHVWGPEGIVWRLKAGKLAKAE